MPPLGRCKLLKRCPQEQRLYALVGRVILNGESRNLRSPWLRIVVASGLLPGDPKLRHVYSATNPPPRVSSCPPSGRPGAALRRSVNDLSISQSLLLLSPEDPQFDPLTASNQFQHTRRRPTIFLNARTTSRRSLKHQKMAITRREYFVKLE